MVRHPREVSFAEFWHLVATELGQARLVLNPKATNIDSLIDNNSDVRAYLHHAIRKTYKQSGCQNLDSPISLEAVLDTLGETAYTLQSDQAGDLFDIELLEEIAWLICDRFAGQVTELLARTAAWEQPTGTTGLGPPTFSAPTSKPRQKANGKPRPAQIISFPNYKIRKANAKL